MSRNNQEVSFNMVVRSSYSFSYKEFMEYMEDKADREDKVFSKEHADKIWDKLVEKHRKGELETDRTDDGDWDCFDTWIDDEIEDSEN